MKKILLSIFILVTLVFIACKKPTPVSSSAYKVTVLENNLESAKAQAKTEHKNLIIFFHASWCHYCTDFKNNVLTSQDVANFTNGKIIFDMIQGDSDYGKAFVTQYNITGYPTFIVLDENAMQLTKRSGATTADEFKAFVTPYLK